MNKKKIGIGYPVLTFDINEMNWQKHIFPQVSVWEWSAINITGIKRGVKIYYIGGFPRGHLATRGEENYYLFRFPWEEIYSKAFFQGKTAKEQFFRGERWLRERLLYSTGFNRPMLDTSGLWTRRGLYHASHGPGFTRFHLKDYHALYNKKKILEYWWHILNRTPARFKLHKASTCIKWKGNSVIHAFL